MANDTTRRALMGAMAVAPLVVAVPAAAATSTAWDEALAAFEQIKVEHDAAWAVFKRDPAGDSEKMQQLADAYCEAEDLLMEMPAPNARALQWKLRKVLETEKDGFTASWSGEYVKPLLDDISRLAGGN